MIRAGNTNAVCFEYKQQLCETHNENNKNKSLHNIDFTYATWPAARQFD